MVGRHPGYFCDSVAPLSMLKFTQKQGTETREPVKKALTCGKQKAGGIQKEIIDIVLGYQERASVVKGWPHGIRE